MADKTIPSFDDFVKKEYKPESPQQSGGGSPPSFDEFVKNEYAPKEAGGFYDEPGSVMGTAGSMLAAPFTSIAHIPAAIADWAKGGFKPPVRQALDAMIGRGPLPSGPPLGIDEPATQGYGNALMAVAPDPGTVMGAAKGGIKGGFNAVKSAKAGIPAASASVIGGMIGGPKGAAIGAGLGALPEVSRGVFQGIKEGIPRTSPPPGSWQTSGMARDIIPAGETRVPISQSTGDDWVHPSPPATMPRVPNNLRGTPIADIRPTGEVPPESTRLPYDYRGVTMPSGKVVGPITPRMDVPPTPHTPLWEGQVNIQPRSYAPFEPVPAQELPSGRIPGKPALSPPSTPRSPLWEGLNVHPRESYAPFEPVAAQSLPSGRIPGEPAPAIPPTPRTPIWEGKTNGDPGLRPFESIPPGRVSQPIQMETPSEMEELLRQSIENAKNRVKPSTEAQPTPLMPVKVRRTI